MADEVVDVETTDETTEPETGVDELSFWKTQSRKNEKRAKANYAAAQELEAVKAEREKLAQQYNSLAEELQQLKVKEELHKWASSAAGETGLPLDAVLMLSADSEKELLEKAAKLAELVKPQPPVVGGDGNHSESRGDSDLHDFAARLFGRG